MTNIGVTLGRLLKATALPIVMAWVAAALPARAGVTDADILDDAKTPGDVVSYGGSPHQHRFSSLAKINTQNVKKLVPAWTFSFGGEKQRGQQAQPLVYKGRMFTTASYSRAFAVDARTGEKIWEYNHRLPEGILPCCDVINRGGALYGDLFIFGTLDGVVVALDQATGKVHWKQTLGDYAAGVSITHAPIVAKGKVMVAIAGSEFGVVGHVFALDANTGKVVWDRPTIEGWMGMKDGKENGITGTTNATWPGDLWKNGGGCAWNGGTYDPETNLSYWGVGNAAPWNPYYRPGDNLYANSTIAIDVDTGKIVWHYQHVPNDAWDFDSISENIPFDLKKDGKVTKAVGMFHKDGFFYVNDRKTGKLLNATPFVKNITWASKIDLTTGRPVETGNRPGNPTAASSAGTSAVVPAAAGEVQKGTTVWTVPNFLGGKNWNPAAFSDDTGLFYVPSNEWGMDIWDEPITYKKGAAYLGAGFVIKPVFKDYIGSLKAIDPKDGHVVWEARNKGVYWGGVLTTHGGLVFTGTPEGFLKAWDAKTGKELWKYNTGSGIIGSPITFELDGEQYVAVVSGWGGAVPLWGGEVAKSHAGITQGGSLWAFKLPK
ncbi:MAG TPA: methanol/ethanol family PQQ-dependent dehydrogenase [Anaeromyxobacter sp.]